MGAERIDRGEEGGVQLCRSCLGVIPSMVPVQTVARELRKDFNTRRKCHPSLETSQHVLCLQAWTVLTTNEASTANGTNLDDMTLSNYENKTHAGKHPP